MRSNDLKPPFLGTKIVEVPNLSDLEEHLDKKSLFSARWQFGAMNMDEAKEKKAKDVLAKMLGACEARSLIAAKIVYGYFQCARSGNALTIEGDAKPHRLDFPRERAAPNRCLADFFPDDFAIFQLVSLGDKIDKEVSAAFGKKEFSESFYLKGLASELTEALAAYSHSMILCELGVEAGQGCRFSPGYPSFPDLFAQRTIFQLLRPIRIGVKLTKTCMMVPEHSTSAIISPYKEATYFRP